MFLASMSFFLTFGITRFLTHWFRGHDDPFRLILGGTHVHHLVWGILLLLLVGYTWLIQMDTGSNGNKVRVGRTIALVYGVGAALTLDEFALWLNLEDVYWEREGRASIDAVMLFGGLVSAGLWGGPFLRALTRHASRLFPWKPRTHAGSRTVGRDSRPASAERRERSHAGTGRPAGARSSTPARTHSATGRHAGSRPGPHA
jgi:hypothetical protein